MKIKLALTVKYEKYTNIRIENTCKSYCIRGVLGWESTNVKHRSVGQFDITERNNFADKKYSNLYGAIKKHQPDAMIINNVGAI